MKVKKLNIWLVIILTTIAAGIVAQVRTYEPIENPTFFDLPLRINGWVGKEIPMEEYVYESLATKYVFLRNYYSSKYKHPMNLSVVWFDDREIAFHAPDACLGGVGNTVQDDSVVHIALDREYEFGRLLVKHNDVEQLVLYFFDVDGTITLSQIELRLKVLARRLLFKRGSVSFVRLMVPVDGNQDAAISQIKDFLAYLMPLLPTYTHTDRVFNRQP